MSDHDNDHLSPEPLSSYEENKDISHEPVSDVQHKTPEREGEGPFRKIDLEWQKKQRDEPRPQYNPTPDGQRDTGARNQQHVFNERQIAFREEVLDTMQDRARDDFNTAHVTEPFRKVDLEKQKSEHEFSARQIEHREKVLDSLQDKMRDDFAIADKGKDRGLER